MNKKVIIVIILIIVVLMGFILIKTQNKKNKNNIGNKNIETKILQSNRTGEYYVLDENNEIKKSSYNKDDLYIYEIDPDYDPKTPESNLDIYSEYENEIEY